MNGRYLTLSGALGVAALLYGPSPALAQAYLGPNLGPFAVLGASTVTCTGVSLITGDLGVSPGTAVTGFPAPCADTGTIHGGNAAAAAAKVDLTAAFATLGAKPCTGDLTGTDLGGLTLTPGVYCFSSSAQLTGILTLDAQGSPSAEWVFKMGSTLTTASASSVVFINGGNPCGAQWLVGSSATLGTGTSFAGNILAQASITMTTGTDLIGRALALTAAVTLDTNDVSSATCVAPPPYTAPTVLATYVAGGAGATYPDGTSFSGITVRGAELAFGSEMSPDGTGAGEFTIVLLGVPPIPGETQPITIEGQITGGTRNAINIAVISGTASVDLGDGMPPAAGIPIVATLVRDPATAQGTVGLKIGATELPTATLNEGSLSIQTAAPEPVEPPAP
jgi:type VI secretion system secreted protein VgrG